MEKTTPEIVSEKLFSQKPCVEKFNNELKKKILKMREKSFKRLQNENIENSEEISPEEEAKIAELADYITKYVQETGKEQAIIDFQTGLNLLNGYKKESPIKSQIRLEEDGNFGEKTLAALLGALRYYDLQIIKKYIKLGTINNTIWNTKNISTINTDAKIERTANKITGKDI